MGLAFEIDFGKPLPQRRECVGIAEIAPFIEESLPEPLNIACLGII